ncbi:YajG family lipoprotein [Oceanicoccus sp. KOV_DT_Chl]|uniref:YajG family lipoprotein n=1 Tax=Oceanicoccus sp. KOV_DT_Chl TaxID=1904639 RepID=UPI001358211B|nr:YajG family lipoprotein [Oceanicoccus sp. KOV_DT_Chl]
MNASIVKTLLISFIVLITAACAYSPQQITINPKIDTTAEHYGSGRAVSVTVEDAREEKALGSRGGVYKDTSVITLANELDTAIARAAEAKLAVQGFNVNNPEATANMKIIIEKLSYDVPEQSVGKKVMLGAILGVELTAGNETYTGRYKTNSERQTVVTPSMASNEEMINTLLSDTLVRLFSDPKLKAFLSNI